MTHSKLTGRFVIFGSAGGFILDDVQHEYWSRFVSFIMSFVNKERFNLLACCHSPFLHPRQSLLFIQQGIGRTECMIQGLVRSMFSGRG